MRCTCLRDDDPSSLWFCFSHPCSLAWACPAPCCPTTPLGGDLASPGWPASTALGRKPGGKPVGRQFGRTPPVAVQATLLSLALPTHVSTDRGLAPCDFIGRCCLCPAACTLQRGCCATSNLLPVQNLPLAQPSVGPCAASVRLVSGSITSLNSRLTQGRLEVLLANGAWSTVCDDGFTDQSATVVCRQVRRS